MSSDKLEMGNTTALEPAHDKDCQPVTRAPTKHYVVRYLDSSELEVTLSKKATGVECLDKVRGWVTGTCQPTGCDC